MNWVIEYDEGNPTYSAIGKYELYAIRFSDGKWQLSVKRKNRPGPYEVVTREHKLNHAKDYAHGMECGRGDDA